LSLGQGPTEEIKEERRKEAVIRNKEAEQQLANFNFRIYRRVWFVFQISKQMY
jgi:hypothetical protein